ncbi:MAG: hypothetical protein DRP11_04175 [Candidatus Aenigmatarchaeota archaeon]|nr:MAG: hypothetical protein DRP11_04175 [Candidatus Aenigmarchaeota archaeon]
MMKRIKELFIEIGKYMEKSDVAELYLLHEDRDIHAFFRLNEDPIKMIHLQGYPSLSSEQEVMLFARLMDYRKIREIRKKGISIGNEHEAVIRKFPDFESGICMSYNTERIVERLMENLSLLNQEPI